MHTTKPKKVCFFCLNAFSLIEPDSEAQIGGTETQLFLLASQMSKSEKFDVHMIVGDFGQKADILYEKILVHKSINLHKDIKQYLIAPFIIWKTLRKAGCESYIASPAGPEIGIIALFCLIKGKKFIFRTASSVDCTFEKKKTFGYLGGTLYSIGIKLAHQIVTQTQKDKENILKFYNADSTTIPNGILINNQPITQKNEIIWIGSPRPVKQPEIFLNIARALPKYKFTMILSHSGQKDIWDNIQQKCKKIPNMEFVGEVKYQAIDEHLKRAKILIGTSLYEGFPNVYLQAINNGCAIISLNVDPNSMINSNRIGYVTNGNVNEIIRLTKSIMQNDKLFLEISENCKNFIKRFDLNEIIKEWVTII